MGGVYHEVLHLRAEDGHTGGHTGLRGTGEFYRFADREPHSVHRFPVRAPVQGRLRYRISGSFPRVLPDNDRYDALCADNEVAGDVRRALPPLCVHCVHTHSRLHIQRTAPGAVHCVCGIRAFERVSGNRREQTAEDGGNMRRQVRQVSD